MFIYKTTTMHLPLKNKHLLNERIFEHFKTIYVCISYFWRILSKSNHTLTVIRLISSCWCGDSTHFQIFSLRTCAWIALINSLDASRTSTLLDSLNRHLQAEENAYLSSSSFEIREVKSFNSNNLTFSLPLAENPNLHNSCQAIPR